MSDYTDDQRDPYADRARPAGADLSDEDASSDGHRPRPGLISSASAPGDGRVSAIWVDSNEQAAAVPAASLDSTPATPTIELTAVECRVVGAMVEKSFLTPDIYPMTTNAMVTACNQKTNRDPVVDYSAVLIDSTLMELRERNLVRRVHSPGSRSTKHRQTLDEALGLNEQQLALMSVLLLRGPQTLGELRTRTERHDVGFLDLDVVDTCLESLASRSTPLVHQLPRQPGHKENRWQHLLSDTDAVDDSPISDSPTEHYDTAVDQPTQPVAGRLASDASSSVLTRRVDELETRLATLQRQLASLAEKLGEPLE